jgi:hypothetical protein
VKTDLKVKFTVEGTHCWPDAPDIYNVFKNPHCHTFIFEVVISTKDSDDENRREIELWDIRRYIKRTATECGVRNFDGTINYKDMSCEGIAQKLFEKLKKNSFNVKSVSVCEEDGLGAIVYE